MTVCSVKNEFQESWGVRYDVFRKTLRMTISGMLKMLKIINMLKNVKKSKKLVKEFFLLIDLQKRQQLKGIKNERK